MPTLLYHASHGTGVSPFDEAVLKVARSGSAVRIVSPYIGVAYLERVIGVSSEWRLISDVQEWLSSLSIRARPRAWAFIREHLSLIHHCPSLHAKTVISDSLAMMGSANLTNHGILGRAEMGILLDDPILVAEMGAWFEDLWRSTAPPLVDEASAYIQWLDMEARQVPSRRPRVTLSSDSKKIRARLAKLESSTAVVAQDEDGTLNLSAVAKAIIVREQDRYDSLESALEAALDRLTAEGDFGFRDVVAAVNQRFTAASVREIYILLVQHCANHVRSVFVESTHNRLVLKEGRFTQSSHESIGPALAPFDSFLAYIASNLAMTQAKGLPTGDQIKRDTGLCERDQEILISELLDNGLLVLDDKPGALPNYTLEPQFDWPGRYKLFPRARAAWQDRLGLDARAGSDEAQSDPEDFAAPPLAGRRLSHSDEDQLPEEIDDSDASYDRASVDRALREAAEIRRQRQSSSEKEARKKADRQHQQVDALLARLMVMILDGRTFSAPKRRGVAKTIAKATGVDLDIAERAIHSDVPVFVLTQSGPDAVLSLGINPDVTVEMLDTYPKTRATCERLLAIPESAG